MQESTARKIDQSQRVKIKSLSRFFPRFVLTKALKDTSFQEKNTVTMKPRQKISAVEI